MTDPLARETKKERKRTLPEALDAAHLGQRWARHTSVALDSACAWWRWTQHMSFMTGHGGGEQLVCCADLVDPPLRFGPIGLGQICQREGDDIAGFALDADAHDAVD